MRGALSFLFEHRSSDGIIPAYAGSTRRLSSRMPPARDHPRVCGEHYFTRTANQQPTGSSPRMRGARFGIALQGVTAGIIPAYAGSTAPAPPRRLTRPDHPRVCGEHPARASSRPARSGSSPRMRGALELVLAGAERTGIIPAYAGSTHPVPPNRAPTWDHPRVCGEHTKVPRAI